MIHYGPIKLPLAESMAIKRDRLHRHVEIMLEEACVAEARGDIWPAVMAFERALHAERELRKLRPTLFIHAFEEDFLEPITKRAEDIIWRTGQC